MPVFVIPRGRSRIVLTLSRSVAQGFTREASSVIRERRRRRAWGPGVETTDFDPLDPAVAADPYPSYKRLLAGPRVHHNPRRGIWVLARYEDVREAGRAHGLLSSAESVTRPRSALPMMLSMDRPEHARLRRVAARHFTRDAIEDRRPLVEGIVRRALDELLADEENDVLGRLAWPVPIEVIAAILGVPPRDRLRFRELSDRVVNGFAVASPIAASSVVSVVRATLSLHAYLAGAFDERRRRGPGEDDLLSHLLAAREEGTLSEDELFWFAFLLLVAGHETTTSLLGSMIAALAEHPGEYARVRDEPALIGPAVEEALRFSSPIQGFYRTALRDYRVGEATIPAGARVLLLFGAANRDPRRYPEPNRFIVDRGSADHLAFGSGIHFCLGAHLARLEAMAVLRALTARVAALEPAGQPEWNGNPSVRALARLPIRLIPANLQSREEFDQ